MQLYVHVTKAECEREEQVLLLLFNNTPTLISQSQIKPNQLLVTHARSPHTDAHLSVYVPDITLGRECVCVKWDGLCVCVCVCAPKYL